MDYNIAKQSFKMFCSAWTQYYVCSTN